METSVTRAELKTWQAVIGILLTLLLLAFAVGISDMIYGTSDPAVTVVTFLLLEMALLTTAVWSKMKGKHM